MKGMWMAFVLLVVFFMGGGSNMHTGLVHAQSERVDIAKTAFLLF